MRPTAVPFTRFTYLIARRQSVGKNSASIPVGKGARGADVLGNRWWNLFGGFRIRKAADELVARQKSFLDLFGLFQQVIVDLISDNRVFPTYKKLNHQ